MPRLLIQSLETGRFLAPSEDGPEWVLRLDEALQGSLSDVEEAWSMAAEWSELGEWVTVVDLDSKVSGSAPGVNRGRV